MSDKNRIKESEYPTTPPENNETVYFEDTRMVYSKDRCKFIKLSPRDSWYSFDLDFDKISEVNLLEGTQCICDKALAGLEHLRTIYIPNSVTHIGDKAFYGCKSIECIKIPDSIRFIGSLAFADCSSLCRFDSVFASDDGRCLVINNVLVAVAPSGLEELYVPESTKSIAFGVFASCSALKRIYLPDSLVKFPRRCFSECSALESIFSKYASKDHKCLIIGGTLILCIEKNSDSYSIPEGVISIGEFALENNVSIKELGLPPSVKNIEYQAFAFCSSLTHIRIPYGVESVGDAAFYQCEQLRDIFLPDSVLSLGSSAFHNCISLKNVVLSNRLKSVEAETFCGCSSLLFISIPDSVALIKERAFDDCKELESVILPKKLKVIENNLFQGCKSLKQLDIPESVKTIKRMSFWGCEELQRVTFPASLESLEEVSFCYCKSLEVADLVNCQNLRKIERSTFSSCSGLKRIVFPESLVHIGEEAFSYCSKLEALSFPKSVKTIGYKAFGDCGMKSVYFQSTDINVDHYAFNFCRKFETVFIPAGTLDFFYPLLKSLTTINFTGHMTFLEVGNSISDVKVETRKLLSDTFISKPLYRLGKCDPDFSNTSERSYIVPDKDGTKKGDIRVIIINCFSSCTGCVRIGKRVVYNWPGDPWMQEDTPKCLFPNSVVEIFRAVDRTKDNAKRLGLLLNALHLLNYEIEANDIEIDETLKRVISYELSDDVEKKWSYVGYASGRDPSSPGSLMPPPGGMVLTTIGFIKALINILGEFLYTKSH
ncbi:MAG: leucine-rich repeat domain-containing protein [Bacteroidales bacterium]|nr:leucine-rich repeat domain-containing protein [Bacteroidales bacterium]